jgi:hypothetical protein
MDQALTQQRAAPAARVAVPARSDKARTWTLLPVIAALVLAAWATSQQRLYTPGSHLGYYMGVVGGLMMLALLLYPLRKRIRFMQSWGATKHWFRLHMTFGIGGPMLILFHSTFHVGSLNAAVALFSMLLVAGSGVVGRFLYARIHHGLYGRRASLQDLQTRLSAYEGDVAARLRINARLVQRLQALEARALATPPSITAAAWRFCTLWAHALWTQARARRDWRLTVGVLARQHHWSRADTARQRAKGALLIREYLGAALSVANFSAYERLLSLWHILHVPLVYMLVFTAVFHVIAVHMY